MGFVMDPLQVLWNCRATTRFVPHGKTDAGSRAIAGPLQPHLQSAWLRLWLSVLTLTLTVWVWGRLRPSPPQSAESDSESQSQRGVWLWLSECTLTHSPLSRRWHALSLRLKSQRETQSLSQRDSESHSLRLISDHVHNNCSCDSRVKWLIFASNAKTRQSEPQSQSLSDRVTDCRHSPHTCRFFSTLHVMHTSIYSGILHGQSCDYSACVVVHVN